jgi:hypothetical protein
VLIDQRHASGSPFSLPLPGDFRRRGFNFHLQRLYYLFKDELGVDIALHESRHRRRLVWLVDLFSAFPLRPPAVGHERQNLRLVVLPNS